ncbi:MAG: hybrid sensor histidine kinase/response regulator [Rhodanobacter sp.]
MHRRAAQGYRVLVVAPWQRDAETLARILAQDGYQAAVYPDLLALSAHIDEETGVVVLTQEALAHNTDPIRRQLANQPAWSDVPFVILRAARPVNSTEVLPLPAEVINRIELERPMSSISLLSAVATAMRSRQKQFEIRNRMQELAASRRALAESEAELRLITDSVPVLIAFIDTDLRYRFVNRAYQAWFGLAPEDMLGKTTEEVFGKEQWDARKEAALQAMAGQATQVELTWPDGGGKRHEVEVRYIPRHQLDGRIDGIHVFATDITERKAMLENARHAAAALELKVAERTAELQAEMQARSESESALRQAQKMEAVGQLTGGIAHDFNNMLTSIICALDMVGLHMQDRDGRLERIIRGASESAFRAAALTQRLLAFSRRQSLDPKPVDVNALVRSMQALLVQTLGEGIRIRVDLTPTVGKALADANQLESALLNLCINARDAMPEGGELRITTRSAPSTPLPREGGAAKSEGFVVLEVADTGTGMTAEVKEHVFEPFFTTKPIGQGTGLGLSMIYGFMQQSEGAIDLQSIPGKGTSFALYFPVTSLGTAPAADVHRADAPRGEGEHILVVEDNEEIRFLVSCLLDEWGYVVAAAPDAPGAMSQLSSLERIDLLISDVGLPGMNGRQLAELVRETHPSVPVLFMTGYAESATVKSDFLGHNMAMIAKPFARDDFSRMVKEALSGR